MRPVAWSDKSTGFKPNRELNCTEKETEAAPVKCCFFSKGFRGQIRRPKLKSSSNSEG